MQPSWVSALINIDQLAVKLSHSASHYQCEGAIRVLNNHEPMPALYNHVREIKGYSRRASNQAGKREPSIALNTLFTEEACYMPGIKLCVGYDENKDV